MTKQWEQYEEIIRALYADTTLSNVRQIMIDQHGFKASVRAYRGRLDRWGVRKYNRRDRNDSVSSGDSREDDTSYIPVADTPAQSLRTREPGSAPARRGWRQRNRTPRGDAFAGTAIQPYPYAPSEHASRYSEDRAQPQPSLQPAAGYHNSRYWQNGADDSHHSPLGASAATGSNSTLHPYYGDYVPATQPLNPWHSSGVYADPDEGFSFGHDGHREGGSSHIELPFVADVQDNASGPRSDVRNDGERGAGKDVWY
ncbi:hypothetical protein DL764_000902 [Monosporascus ibericus]|uniref:Clr5 domain-containing protein n=1 Tax=Monosporascus ibericus TaxID=155417 RepID=A0A4Q4TU55_9PEZI|nr:hypothetical protein DL764_000902 [Monosporascus ibericus]